MYNLFLCGLVPFFYVFMVLGEQGQVGGEGHHEGLQDGQAGEPALPRLYLSGIQD